MDVYLIDKVLPKEKAILGMPLCMVKMHAGVLKVYKLIEATSTDVNLNIAKYSWS